ncbi:MAG: EamA family transporter [Alphaproteobacteria bacterium]|nr:MAG: EamA family transporter [Alphaproteobacteria bacterium]
MTAQTLKTVFYTSFALLAFAGNSVLCRLALGENTIDAASFTIIRLLSGIITLLIILKLTRNNGKIVSRGSWSAAFMLFLYALTFSFAYISLDTGTGALILFGAVQITMIFISLFSGNRLHYFEWAGMAIAFSGFAYLVTPSLTTPSLTGFFLMAVAGIAWGFYTLKGRHSQNPISDTAYNFLRTLPLVIILLAVSLPYASLSREGVLLAILSGAVASGIGYAVWYIALGGLDVSKAAVVQLLVPVIAATGGVLFAGEIISQRLILSSVMVLGGILTVVMGKHYLAQRAMRNK